MSLPCRAAAYIRVSTEEQLEFSPDSQIKKIREYALHNNIEISDENIFLDEGISGRQAEKRPAFMKMISVAKKKPKPFDIILVWKFSRFARNREDSIVYKSMLRKECGIDVVSISEQIGEDKTSILIEALLEAMDEYYSVNLADEVKRGMNEKFSRGGIVSPPPFGYRMGGGIFVADKENAEVVRMIFEDFLSGMGLRGIAVKLNEIGIRSARGNAFENRTVEYILTNPVYTGKLRRNPNGRDGNDRFHQSENNIIINSIHEPIIDCETFEKANEKLREKKKQSVRYSRFTDASFMLRGLVRCSDCGSTLVQAVSGRALQCCKYARGQCGSSHSVTIEKINEAVLKKAAEDFADGQFEFNIGRKTKSDRNINQQLIKKEQKKLERIRAAFECGADSVEEYKTNKARILSRIAALEELVRQPEEETEQIVLKEKAAVILAGLKSRNIDENDKNELLRAVISKIVFDRSNDSIRIFYNRS